MRLPQMRDRVIKCVCLEVTGRGNSWACETIIGGRQNQDSGLRTPDPGHLTVTCLSQRNAGATDRSFGE